MPKKKSAKRKKAKKRSVVKEALYQRKKAKMAMQLQAVHEIFRTMDAMKRQTIIRVNDFGGRKKALENAIAEERAKSFWKRDNKKLTRLENALNEREEELHAAKNALASLEAMIAEAKSKKKAGDVAKIFEQACSAVDAADLIEKDVKKRENRKKKGKLAGKRFFDGFVNRYADAFEGELSQP